MAELLDANQIGGRLAERDGWSLKGKEIEKGYVFADFREAMRFVNAVAAAAEKLDHHPDIFVSYNKVRLGITTHSAGGLTDKDFDLARDIDFI